MVEDVDGSSGAHDPRPPDFETVDLLGRGASGVVLLVRRSDGSLAAVKRLHGDWVSEEALARFRRESRLLQRLEHPHIVRSEGFGIDDGSPWILMGYVDGPNLRELLQASPLSTANALTVLSCLADAVGYAHAQGVLHRDLTPANVLFMRTGRPMLADFGVAKMLGPGRVTSMMTFRTHTGALIGTPAYMSPESARGVTELTGASDVYSLGVLAYRLFVGRLPFPFEGDVLATLEAHINQPVPSPTDLGVSLPPALEGAVLRALAKNPDDRPSGADDFWAELGEAADAAWPRWRDGTNLEIPVSRVSPPGTPIPGKRGAQGLNADGEDDAHSTVTGFRAGAGSATKLPTERIASPVFAPKKRRRWPGLVAAAVVGVGVALGLLAVGGSSPPSPPLAVQSVLVTASPLGAGGHCPRTFLLNGHIHTNGGPGMLTYQWSLAGRPLGPVHRASLRSGETVFDQTTRVVAAGTDVTSTNAVLRVLHPSQQGATSASLSLHCP
jgi:eukaryotic-like serine/threonine-protein kinase